MKEDIIKIDNFEMKVYCLNTVIVGSGAAGYNAADSLYNLGQKDIAIITEGINMGTSRNTGSDKQTYYKLSLEGDTKDSVKDMAKTLFNGECMHGDIALVEAAMSARCFSKLADIGVPFPHNRYGEYIGYKTDHDPSKRATSAGPLTSKFMTEMLEKQVKSKDIAIFDGYRVIGILTNKKKGEAIGLIAINVEKTGDANMGFTLFNCTNIVYAVGGPGGMYQTSVYPQSQTGASGIAFQAGVKGINLTESQYGIASVKFRWNLSGTYQQVIPRYISTDKDGSDEKEFLNEYFKTPREMLDAIFLKGYQWPFDPRKIDNLGSSLIDILVYNETQLKGRRVFMDFMHNPSYGSEGGKLDFSQLGSESYNYLKNSGVLFGTPIERLEKMNTPAINLYLDNGIDLRKERLEIAVCAQHNNGGLLGNIWWESNIKHLFPVGEVCGTFGVYRPGGTALNSTQVGSLRAAQYITSHYGASPLENSVFKNMAKETIYKLIKTGLSINASISEISNVYSHRNEIKENMSRYGAHIRSIDSCNKALSFCNNKLKDLAEDIKIKSYNEIPEVFINIDMLITQYVYLSAIKEYIKKGGKSRGSYLVQDENGCLPHEMLSEVFRFSLEDGSLKDKVCEISFENDSEDMNCISDWKKIRPIPNEENWFENVWNDYLNGDIIK